MNDVGLDYYLIRPWDPPTERLYPVVTNLVENPSTPRARAPRSEAAQRLRPGRRAQGLRTVPASRRDPL